MAKSKVSTRRRAAGPKVPPGSRSLRDAVKVASAMALRVIEIERVVSRVQAQLGLVNLILAAKRTAGKDLDIGEAVYIHDVLGPAEIDLINIAWPIARGPKAVA